MREEEEEEENELTMASKDEELSAEARLRALLLDPDQGFVLSERSARRSRSDCERSSYQKQMCSEITGVEEFCLKDQQKALRL